MNQPIMSQEKVCEGNCNENNNEHVHEDTVEGEDEYLYDDDEELEDDEYYEDEYGSMDKWKYSLYSAIVFLIISYPYTYMVMNRLLGSFIQISSPSGCPTLVGILIHTIVFGLVIRGIMELDI